MCYNRLNAELAGGTKVHDEQLKPSNTCTRHLRPK